MLAIFRWDRSQISTYLLALFLLILGCTALISEFFRGTVSENHELGKYNTLFTSKDFENVEELKITNRIGTVELIKNKTNDAKFIPWIIPGQRNFPAQNQVIEQLIKSLNDIKIVKIYNKDPINTSNFSLNPPLISLSFKSKLDTFVFDLGLIDSITNTTYATLSNKELIYQVVIDSQFFEKLDLSNLIEPRIFPMPIEDISEFTVFNRAKTDKDSTLLQIIKKDQNWVDPNGKDLDDEKVNEYLNSITQLKTNLILDKISKNLEEKIEESFTNLQYTIHIKDINGNISKFLIGAVVNQLPDLKIEKRQNILIRSSNRNNSYIISKEQLGIFQKKTNQFSKLPIRKLFY